MVWTSFSPRRRSSSVISPSFSSFLSNSSASRRADQARLGGGDHGQLLELHVRAVALHHHIQVLHQRGRSLAGTYGGKLVDGVLDGLLHGVFSGLDGGVGGHGGIRLGGSRVSVQG